MAALGRTLTVSCANAAEVASLRKRLADEPCTVKVKGLMVTIVYAPEDVEV